MLNDELKSKAFKQEINEILNNYNIDKYYSKLELYFNKSTFFSKDKLPEDDPESSREFNETLDSFKSLTAKEEFLRKIR